MRDWVYCAHCQEFFYQGRPEQRYCSSLCSCKSRTLPPMVKIPGQDPLADAVDACAKFIVNAGDRNGVVPRNLAKYVGQYLRLDADERFRANVLICKAPGIAYSAEQDPLTGTVDFKFWPRRLAPEWATRVTDPSAP